MNEEILIEMKNKASNIRNLIDECNELMNYLENITNKIKSKKEQLKSDDISLESKSKLQIEIDLKEKQKKSLEDWLNTKDELIDETKVTKSYDAFKTYLELKNKEFGKTDAVNVNEVEDLFLDFNDYIKLNKKNQSHVDAINMLSNPDYFDQVYTRMEQGAELAYFQLLHDAAEEQIKAGLVKPDEHFIVEANGRYGVFTPTGQIVSITDNIDEARKVKDELDKELKQTKVTQPAIF
jgi:hypothetical protein